MKRILITGANSYIGASFERYVKENYADDYVVDTIDMVDGSWREKSFAGYDSVFHVAGIAHQKETRKNAPLYYKVNRDLAIETATKAKADGVKQFVFLSSMSVYGMEFGVITKDTKPIPKSNYGISKWEAEQGITLLTDSNFDICIIRPPMVYGKGCKGNFNVIYRFVKKFPIFPQIKNQRSMIYIDNLSEFVKLCVDKKMSGVYCPQNQEYVSTVDMARIIAESMNKKVHFDCLTGFAVRIMRPFFVVARKGFGTLVYNMDEPTDYCIVSNEESIRRSV